MLKTFLLVAIIACYFVVIAAIDEDDEDAKCVAELYRLFADILKTKRDTTSPLDAFLNWASRSKADINDLVHGRFEVEFGLKIYGNILKSISLSLRTQKKRLESGLRRFRDRVQIHSKSKFSIDYLKKSTSSVLKAAKTLGTKLKAATAFLGRLGVWIVVIVGLMLCIVFSRCCLKIGKCFSG